MEVAWDHGNLGFHCSTNIIAEENLTDVTQAELFLGRNNDEIMFDILFSLHLTEFLPCSLSASL